MPGRDKGKYEKIYQKNGVMTKGGGYEGRYGEDEELDRKWDRYGCAYEGLDGTMVMFPSQVLHHVEPQTANKERITLAFNISQYAETRSDSVYT